MPIHPRYLKAPITEALIDLQVEYDSGVSLEKLKRFGAEIRDQYPNEATRDLLKGQITFAGPAPQSQSSRTTMGYIFHSGQYLGTLIEFDCTEL
jgi:uncharacterized protein (TIGR04255 family)